MNKPIYTAFVAFWSIIGTLVVLGLLQQPPAHADGKAATEKAYTLADVAKHANAASCWMAIEGVVYDFTAYLPKHPTPPKVMLDWCGKEATRGMREKGDRKRPHSDWAWEMMAEYRIGVLAK